MRFLKKYSWIFLAVISSLIAGFFSYAFFAGETVTVEEKLEDGNTSVYFSELEADRV